MTTAMPASTSTVAVDLSACPNCGEPFAAPRPKFCPACGQESTVRPPKLGEFLQQFGGAYFATEGALWRTLKLLLTRPGELTVQYLAGRRKHYVLPLRLYLSAALLMLLALRLTGSLVVAEAPGLQGAQKLPERPRSVSISLGLGSAGMRDGVYFCEGLPVWLCTRLQKRLDHDTKGLIQEAKNVGDRLLSNAGAMMIVLMPAFAAGLALLYRNRRLRYTEHLVFALHLHAFWALVAACMAVGWDIVTLTGLLALPGYALLAMRRVYGGRWHWLLLRFFVLTSAHAMVVLFTVVVAALLALLL